MTIDVEREYMGLLKKDPLKEIFKDYENDDILEAAKMVSSNDAEVVRQMDFALKTPVKYINQYAERFSERGIELDDPDSFEDLDSDDLMFIAMVDELEERNYAFEFDYKCGLKDFLWGLEQLKNYSFIKDVIRTIKLDENEDVEAWGKQINEALGEKAVLCYIYIDSDSYPLTILTAEELEKIPIPMIMAM